VACRLAKQCTYDMTTKSVRSPAHLREHRSATGDAWHQWFSFFARETSHVAGSPVTFLVAVFVIVVWAVTGPLFHFSDTWQLVINTGTTIVTFLMVFLIQNTQNRDTLAVQIKLAELIVAMKGAENRLANAEELSDQELEDLHEQYRRCATTALDVLAKRRTVLEGAVSQQQPGRQSTSDR
jgi:low affinity Fe/Cu permease